MMDRPLSLDNTISTEEPHLLLEDVIAQYQALILSLNPQQNATSPISCLPPEILCQIFSIVKADAICNRTVDALPKCLKWIDVTYVCSYWRQVALSAAYLWVDPPLGNARWVKEMLRRSKDLGLVIEVECHSECRMDMTQGFELAMRQSFRIKHMDIRNMNVRSPWKKFQKALQKVAPQLEYLSLSRGPQLKEWIHHPLIVAEEVFRKMECIRHLELVRCSRNWSLQLPLLPHLTHLTLSQLWEDCRPTGKQFVHVLKSMPVLQSLRLTQAFPIERVWDTDQIHIASLQSLYIASVPAEVETFFRYVTFPPTATVEVMVESSQSDQSPGGDRDMSGVISSISQSYSNPTTSTTFPTVICSPSGYESSREIHFQLVKGPLIDKYGYDNDVKLDLWFAHWTHAPPHRFMENLMSRFCSSVLLQQDAAIHLNLTEVGRLSVQTLANVFGIIPQVHSVVVYYCHRFFEALGVGQCKGQEAGSITSANKLCFPNVSSIYFHGTDFSESSIQLLKDCLIRRSECGARVHKLHFDKQCKNIHKFDIDSLSQIVDEVHWDLDKPYA